MSSFQEAKRVVRQYFDAMEHCAAEDTKDVLQQYMAEDYNWKGVHPFGELRGVNAVAEAFWQP